MTPSPMIELHPEILKKNGKSEFVILPYEEFLLLQERLADAEDLEDLRDAVRAEGDAPTISLEELKLKLAAASAAPEAKSRRS
jgi:hypothetical protein